MTGVGNLCKPRKLVASFKIYGIIISTMSHSSLRAYGEAISMNIAPSRLLRHYAPRNDTCLKCDIVKLYTYGKFANR
jgi:hypothetical protein